MLFGPLNSTDSYALMPFMREGKLWFVLLLLGRKEAGKISVGDPSLEWSICLAAPDPFGEPVVSLLPPAAEELAAGKAEVERRAAEEPNPATSGEEACEI